MPTAKETALKKQIFDLQVERLAWMDAKQLLDFHKKVVDLKKSVKDVKPEEVSQDYINEIDDLDAFCGKCATKIEEEAVLAHPEKTEAQIRVEIKEGKYSRVDKRTVEELLLEEDAKVKFNPEYKPKTKEQLTAQILKGVKIDVNNEPVKHVPVNHAPVKHVR